MCCRTSVSPLLIDVAETVLMVGQFKPVYWSPAGALSVATNWEREVQEEDGGITVVHASLRDGSLELNLAPAISVFSQHHGKRNGASVYFEIAAKYAEKVNGLIEQKANVVGCKVDPTNNLVLAQYPDMPLAWDRVCAGFQSILLPHSHDD